MYFQLFGLRFSLPFLVFPITNPYPFSMRFPPALIHSFLSLPPGISYAFTLGSQSISSSITLCIRGFVSYNFSCSRRAARINSQYKKSRVFLHRSILGLNKCGFSHTFPSITMIWEFSLQHFSLRKQSPNRHTTINLPHFI